MTEGMRMESDSIGTMEVPKEAYYGVQALRAKQNFPITGQSLHPVFIRNLAKVKKAAAQSNRNALALPADKAEAIIRACDEVIRGCFADEFIVDAIQGGAGTSANMNMNEVLANRANEWMGGRKGDYSRIHPNDHVNMSQSTNDVIPTAGKLTVLELLKPLLAELDELERELRIKAAEFDGILKMGRTQLQDAVPMRLGQTFHAYATMVKRDYERLKEVRCEMFTVNLGGTAIGTAINVSPAYLSNVVPTLAKITGYPLKQAEDLFDATENLDGFVMVSGALKACAVDLSKMCNDLRLLSSGPRTGFGEINLPARQNGSSIMPGKVNPVIPEVVNQVAFNIIGNDVTITMAAEGGQLELNAFEPIIFYCMFQSIDTLAYAVQTFIDNCVSGITANEERCRSLVENSVGIVTAICPHVGYKKSAEIAKKALATGQPVRNLILQENLMTADELDSILDPVHMTEPGISRKDILLKKKTTAKKTV